MARLKFGSSWRWSWSGLVASILAVGLVVGWSASVIIVATHGGEYVLPVEVIQAQQALGQTLAGGLIGYLGARAMHANEIKGGDSSG